MPGVSAEQIARAKEIPILDYILAHEPDNVRRVGNEYRLKDHSVTMSNGKWHWQSHGVGGEKATALNYLITVRGYSFVDAVRHLTGDTIIYDIVPKARPPTVVVTNSTMLRPSDGEHSRRSVVPPLPTDRARRGPRRDFALPRRNQDNERVIAYLKSRGIAEPLIHDCIRRGSLYESARYHNCVYATKNKIQTILR